MDLWGSLRILSNPEVKSAGTVPGDYVFTSRKSVNTVSSYFFSFCIFSPGMKIPIV